MSIDPLAMQVRNAAQKAVCFLCCKNTFLAHGQLGVCEDPEVLSKAAFQPVGLRCVLLPGVIPLQMQDFALPFIELHEILF